MDDTLILFSSRKEQDDKGVWRVNAVPRTVFCQVHSITRQEFFEGGRNGLNPSFMFTVFQGDYEGEAVCEYKGQSYAIYRTYLPANVDYIELYAERQGGTNGKTA